MSNHSKQISNPLSTGGLGIHFENRVQTAFSVLMLAGGFCPCLPNWPINKIKLQGRYENFEIDDLIVYCQDPNTGKRAKLLGQVKHTVKITKNNKVFEDVIQAAWNDFNNPKIFSSASKDAIALICGPLSATDTVDVRQLLEQSRYSESASDFFDRIERGKFTSNAQREKLEVFKEQLKAANKNVELNDEELWSFLKSFHLLIYDLDIKGVTLSLLHTLIGQYSRNNANSLWSQLKDHIEWISENAGFITISSIPEEISSVFKKVQVETIPSELVKDTIRIDIEDWHSNSYSSQLTIASIVGSWNENSIHDKSIISKLAREEYENWIIKLRKVLQLSVSPILLKNGIWSIKDRRNLLNNLGAGIFDDNLDAFKECVVNILSERDPKFELPKENQFSASIYGKVFNYSKELRKGLAETLVLLSCCSTALNKCSLNKAENTTSLAVREILIDADWVLWASLNDLMPLLAEAAPNEFLSAVEHAIQQNPCPFDIIFSQEEAGITGWNYMTGLLGALETLAWEESYLVRVSVLLGALAALDPGGKWANRPSNSLITIFLPWLPQTMASFDKRKVAIRTLEKEEPEVAWEVVLNLLPKQLQSTFGSNKPKWRQWIPQDWNGRVSDKEYKEQVTFYSEFAVEIARDNLNRLCELISKLDNLPKQALDKLLTYLSSKLKEKSEDLRTNIWTSLVKFKARYKRFSADSQNPILINKIEELAIQLEPKDPLSLYARLFNGHDFDLYEEKGNWEEQEKQLEEQRQEAIRQVLKNGGVEAVFHFLNKVDLSSNVGSALGAIAGNEIDTKILPFYLDNKEKKLEQFISAYVWSRYYHQGSTWVDNLDSKSWPKLQLARLYTLLPFTSETWQRVSAAIGEEESLYWKHVFVNPRLADADLDYVIDKLIENERPYTAINCLYWEVHEKKTLNTKKTIKILLDAVSSNEEPDDDMSYYYVTEIIKFLQDEETIKPDDLYLVEWAYLPLLDEYNNATPKYLESRLATIPAFFCEIIRLVYRSENEPKSEKELTKQERSIAESGKVKN